MHLMKQSIIYGPVNGPIKTGYFFYEKILAYMHIMGIRQYKYNR